MIELRIELVTWNSVQRLYHCAELKSWIAENTLHIPPGCPFLEDLPWFDTQSS